VFAGLDDVLRTRDLWVSWVERQRVIGERVSGSTESPSGFHVEGLPGVVFLGLSRLPFGPLSFPAGHESSTDELSLRGRRTQISERRTRVHGRQRPHLRGRPLGLGLGRHHAVPDLRGPPPGRSMPPPS
jgi:hypothetical protein